MHYWLRLMEEAGEITLNLFYELLDENFTINSGPLTVNNLN